MFFYTRLSCYSTAMAQVAVKLALCFLTEPDRRVYTVGLIEQVTLSKVTLEKRLLLLLSVMFIFYLFPTPISTECRLAEGELTYRLSAR